MKFITEKWKINVFFAFVTMSLQISSCCDKTETGPISIIYTCSRWRNLSHNKRDEHLVHGGSAVTISLKKYTQKIYFFVSSGTEIHMSAIETI